MTLKERQEVNRWLRKCKGIIAEHLEKMNPGVNKRVSFELRLRSRTEIAVEDARKSKK
jgi:hypothetical protein